MKETLSFWLTPISTALSIMSAIVYITCYAGSLDKRIAVVESDQLGVDDKISTLRDNLDTINRYQDRQQTQFKIDVQSQLAQMGGRIEKIYTILLDARRHETI